MQPSRRLVGPLLVSALCLLASATGARATTSAPANRVLVKVSQTTKLGKILVTAKGMTLYYLMTETHGKIRCTGACATVWHPLVLPSGIKKPAAVPGATGRVAMVIRPGGAQQITWNGRPLYTFIGDKKPGQTNGQGINKVWWVVVVSAPRTTSGSNSGGGW